MSSPPIPAIIETVVRYECPKCGNNCQCGVPYVPKTARAAEAIKANPEKSNRAIAKEIGADKVTVDRARKKLEQTGDVSPVAERIGLDDVKRKVPEPAPEPPAATFLDKPWLALAANEGEPAAADPEQEEAWPPKDYPTISKAEVEPILKTIIGWRFRHPYRAARELQTGGEGDDDALPYIIDGDLALYDLAQEAFEVMRLLRCDGEQWSEAVDEQVRARDKAEREADAAARRERAKARAANKKKAAAE